MSEQDDLYDVVMVNLKTRKVRVGKRNCTATAAEVWIAMALYRRGVNEEFYVDVASGRYKDGDVYRGRTLIGES